MPRKKYINVVVAAEDRSGVLSFRLPFKAFYALTAAVSVGFVAFVVLIMNQAMDEAKLTELEFLRKQNGQLKEKVERVAVLEKKLTELEVVEDKLMVMAGERDALRELKAVSVKPGDQGKTAALTISDSWARFKSLAGARRGITLNAPQGDPVKQGWITRGFGEQSGLEGSVAFHHGVDIAVPPGSPVYATAPGVVIFAGDDAVYGKLVIIQHSLTGYSTFYGHNSSLNVKPGTVVKRGDVIATTGNSGKSTAPHLHYEVRLHGVPVNPAKYIKGYETAEEEPAPVVAETASPPATPPAKTKEETGEIPTKPKEGEGGEPAPATP